MNIFIIHNIYHTNIASQIMNLVFGPDPLIFQFNNQFLTLFWIYNKFNANREVSKQCLFYIQRPWDCKIKRQAEIGTKVKQHIYKTGDRKPGN